MSRVSKKTVDAVRAQERAEVDAREHAPRFLVIFDLIGAGARILEEAAILRGGDLQGAEDPLDGLRRAVSGAMKSFAAYDAAVAAGMVTIPYVQWQMLCNGDRRVIPVTVKDFDGAIEVHT